MKKFAILVSGNGTNLQAVLDAIAEKKFNAEVSVVVSNVANAFALERAKSANTTAVFFPKKPFEKRSEYNKRLASLVTSFQVDYVLLLGWMLILTENFLNNFTVINLHPALPKTFVGTNCIEKQFEAFQKGEISECGIMTHFVPDEKVDAGPVIFAKKVPCFKNETLADFEKRIHESEHCLVIKTVEYLLEQ
ncbi:MAG: phosphoribosylglycinamide formyltransferase [Treponemataceae bacterium]